MNRKINIFCYLLLSIIAAIIILILTLFPSAESILSSEKNLIAILFTSCCIFGISIAISPGWFRRLIKLNSHHVRENQSLKSKMKYSGHHPDCKKFLNHKIRVKNKTYCAGCLGLALGSFICIIILIFYIFVEFVSSVHNQSFIILALILISINYVEIFLPARKALVHVVSNVLLIVGFLIITLSIFQISGKIIYAIVGLIFSFLWLDTRVQFSSWQHSRICKKCENNCKIY